MHLLKPILEGSVALAATAGTAAVVANAALRPGSQLFGRTIVSGHNPREFALTYDDGPNPSITPSLLDLLAEYNVRATFFMIGRWARKEQQLARRVLAEGHLIGNHTMSHPWLSFTTAAKVRAELSGCSKVLEDVLGAPVRYFRPPHGARRPVVIRAAHELGMEVVQWNVMGMDWEKLGVDTIVGHLKSGMRRAQKSGRGSNILLHDGSERGLGADRMETLRATEALLTELIPRGRHAVTVDAWDPRND